MAEAIALQTRRQQVIEQPQRNRLGERTGFADRADAHRAAGLAVAAGNQRAGLRQQLLLHAPQRRAEADAARVGVVDEDARRRTHTGCLFCRLPTRKDTRCVFFSRIHRQADVARVAHQQQLRHLLHGKRQADHAVAAVVSRVGKSVHHRERNLEPVRRGVHLLLGQVELARADVLVGVELDLLEADHPRHHVHFPVQRDARRIGGEAIEDGHLGVGDRGRVVIAVHFPDVRLAAHEVELFDLEDLALHHVDGLGMQRRQRAREVGLANHLRSVGVIGDDKVVGRDRPQAHGVGRVRLARPMPLPWFVVMAGPVHEARLLQHAQHFLHVHLAVRLLRGERQFERRALHVVHQDVQVVGIDQRMFGRGVEEVRGVAHHELVDRRAGRHHHRRRLAAAAAGAAGALPRRGNRAGIAGHHAHVERADVDAELERVGRDHAAHLAGAQAFLDLAPAQRQVAAAIAANALGHAGHVLEVFLEIGRQNLGGEPALREHDHLQVAAQELPRHAPRFGDVRLADAKLAIHHRRIDEDEELLASRGAAFVDERERPFRQPLRQLRRVGDGRRRADELRIRSVVPADALQAP